MISTGWLRRALTAPVALLLALAAVLAPTAPASAAEWYDTSGGWYDGPANYSQVLNCWSVIQGAPYYEKGIGAYMGYLADPERGHPAVGERGYIHYTVYGMGNPCPGGSYFRPRFYLPQGMAWDTSRPIACGYDDRGATAPSAGCPGWEGMDASNAYWNNEGGATGNMWGVAQGHHWEFQLPVRMTQALTNAPMQMHLDVADGNHNPQMLLEAPVYVFASSSGGGGGTGQGGVSVLYDQPSTYDSATLPESTTPSRYGVISHFQTVLAGRGGTARLEISTSPTMAPLLGQDQVSFGANQYTSARIWTDWESATVPTLVPGTTYYWRGVVQPTGEAAVTGAVQSFRLKAGGGLDPGGAVVPPTTGNPPGAPGTGGGLGGGLTPIPVPTPQPPVAPAPVPTPPVPPAPVARAAVSVSAKVLAGSGPRVRVRVSVRSSVGTPSGKVVVKVGRRTLGRGSLDRRGSVTVRLKALPAGVHKLVATYAGDATHAPGRSRTVRVRVR